MKDEISSTELMKRKINFLIEKDSLTNFFLKVLIQQVEKLRDFCRIELNITEGKSNESLTKFEQYLKTTYLYKLTVTTSTLQSGKYIIRKLLSA